MANEITMIRGMRCSNGLLVVNEATVSKTFDQTTARGGGPGTVSVGTSEETLAFGDITNPAWMQLVNLDTANYVQVGFSTGVYGLRLRPNGGFAEIELEPSATVYIKANTAACLVKVTALSL